MDKEYLLENLKDEFNDITCGNITIQQIEDIVVNVLKYKSIQQFWGHITDDNYDGAY